MCLWSVIVDDRRDEDTRVREFVKLGFKRNHLLRQSLNLCGERVNGCVQLTCVNVIFRGWESSFASNASIPFSLTERKWFSQCTERAESR